MEKQVIYEISETTQLVIHGLTRQIHDLEHIISNLETDVEALIKLRDNDRIQAEYSMDLQERKIERLTNLLITHYNDTTWFDQTVSI
jgi:hypothetical protein